MIDINEWAYKAGSADAYYGRPIRPHFYGMGSKMWGREVTNLTDEQKEAYLNGYYEEEDRKQW